MAGATIAHRWFDEVWNQRRAEVMDELYTPDTITHGITPDGTPIRGTAALKAFHQAFCQAFPDLRVDVKDVLEDGNRMAVHFVASGTHTGPGLPLPPSGKRITVRGMVFARIENGRFVEGWNLYDRLSLLTQIGQVSAQPI
jgi:steroid delta-isomerase-like uncharacterized protein